MTGGVVETGNTARDAAEIFADHLARVGFSDLPSEVVSAAKASILDTLGCLLAGTATSEVEPIVSLVRERGGRPASTVIGRGFKAPAGSAVLANAAAVHQHDFDDTHDEGICHPTSASLIPALAAAEAIGGVSGKELIAAVALANDLVCRLALAIPGKLSEYLWFRPPVVGIFGAAAACAKIMGASAGQHLEALGLTLPMAGGTLASAQHTGSSVRSVRDGLAYRSGVLAAELAMRGMRGDRDVFEGPFGLYQAFFRGEYDRDKLVRELGTRFETSRVSLKPWPSVRALHRTLTAVSDIMRAQNLSFENVDTVLVHVGTLNRARCWPLQTGAIPGARMDALGNLPFMLGAVLKHGTVPLAVLRDCALADEIILSASPKVKWVYDERLDGPWTFEPALVEITNRAGCKYTGECQVALGHPDLPLSGEQREGKFRDCAASAYAPMSRSRVDRVIEVVNRLEDLDDVGELAKLLA